MLTITSTPKGFRVNGGKVIFKKNAPDTLPKLAGQEITTDHVAQTFQQIADTKGKGAVRQLRKFLRNNGLASLAGLERLKPAA